MLKLTSRSLILSLNTFFMKLSTAALTTTVDRVTKINQSIDFKQLKHPTKVPLVPHLNRLHQSTDRTEIDDQTVQLLERLSLVNLDGNEALETLRDSITFASRILAIDTTNVTPLYSVLEDKPLQLRNDIVTDGNIRTAILQNAAVTEEEYFVVPPGNIPLLKHQQDDQSS